MNISYPIVCLKNDGILVERLRELYGDIIPPNQSLEKVFKIGKVSHEYTIKSKG